MNNIPIHISHLFRAFFVMLVFFVQSAVAQEITFTGSAKNNVATGERFQITYTLNTNGTNFQAPSFADFDLLSGPSQSTSMSIINGAVSQSISFTYLLQAKKEGTFTIKPAKITVKNSEIPSNSIAITVVKGSAPPAQSQQQGGRQQDAGAPAQTSAEGNLFVKVLFDKRKAWVGEPIIATYKIYSRSTLVGFEDIKFPAYNGFWTEDLPGNSQMSLQNEVVDGVVYQTGVFKQTILYPQKSGNIEIEPFVVDVVVRERTRNTPQSVFDQFFGGYQDVKLTAKSKSQKLEVMPLPLAGKPDKFSGVSGKFKMAVKMNKKEVKANEAVNLSITISGNGNLKMVNPPDLSFPPDIESYEPKTTDNISVNASGISGSRTFEYLLIPRFSGDFKIGPFEFSYFDLDKKAYTLIREDAIEINVAKGAGVAESNNTAMISASKEDLKILGSDIRYIKTGDPNLQEKGDFFFGSAGFYIALFSPALLFVFFLFFIRKHEERSGNLVLMKQYNATKLAKKRLSLANKYLKENKSGEFYDEIFKAMWGYIGDKLGIAVSDLSKDNIQRSLEQKNFQKETIQKFMDVLDKSEFARFAPSGGSRQMDEVYTESVNIISEMESKVS